MTKKIRHEEDVIVDFLAMRIARERVRSAVTPTGASVERTKRTVQSLAIGADAGLTTIITDPAQHLPEELRAEAH